MDSNLATQSFEFDNEEKSFTIVLKCTELVSVNTAHGINTKTRVIFDNPWLTKFKTEMRNQLIRTDPVKHCPWIKNNQFYYLAVKYVMKHHFHSRDLDNVHKYTQDMIAEACHINDARIIEVHSWKNFRPGENEYIIIKFGVSNYDYNQFN